MTPTPEQQAIIDVARSKESIMVSAFAGCAKTSTLVMASRKVVVPTLALAFNKKIADEIKGKLPSNFTVRTLNGMGHFAWARSIASSVQLDERKLGKLVSQVAKEAKVNISAAQWERVRGLVIRAMQVGIVPESHGLGLTPDEPEEWSSLVDEDDGMVFDLAHRVLECSIDLARQGIISFDDQVYCSVCLGGKFPQFPVVFVDEAQDLSPLQHQLVRLSSRADAKLVIVGDPKQAIYAWRGASSRSMESMRLLRPDWLERPLAMTFRCPRVIVERQRNHALGFRAASSCVDGRFINAKGHDWGLADFDAWRPGTESSLVVLCRNNGPLLVVAFKLLRRGIPVVMQGRDIGKGLEAVAARLHPISSGPDGLLASLAEWEENELAKAGESEGKVESIRDRAECLRAVIEGSLAQEVDGLRSAIRRVFAITHGQIILSSIHRAKGLEWDVVVHLDSWRIGKHARSAVEMEQERNLLYVAETRARQVLVEANLEDFL